MRSSIAVVLFAFALPAAVAAQGGPPAPAPEVAQLSFFAGTWSCKGTVEATPFGPAHATQATVRIARDLGGFWYVGRFQEAKTAANPHPMRFDFYQGWDANAKAFTLDGFDVLGNHSHQTAAGWQDGKLVYLGESAGTPARDTFAKTGDKTLEHTGEMQLEGNWTKIDHETCTRTGK